VTEEEIADALRAMYHRHHERIEGAAGVAVAATLKDASRFAGKRVVVILCGGNIEDKIFQKLINDQPIL
jgi:threonine dehydratase